MEIDLSRKVVLITGATGGIGTSIVNRFAECGASLILAYHSDKDAAEILLRSINAKTKNNSLFHFDLGQSKSIYLLMDFVKKQYGRLDILINNAGYKTDNEFLKISDEELKNTMEVNFTGPFICARESAKIMVENGGGKILFVTSVDAERPGHRRSHYAAAKAAQTILMKDIALELADKNITVNAVAPGAIRTNMTAKIMTDRKLHDRMVKGIAMGKIGEPDEIANLIIFLSSDLSNYTTGAVFLADGGLSLLRGY